jgi:hypothetical protein
LPAAAAQVIACGAAGGDFAQKAEAFDWLEAGK